MVVFNLPHDVPIPFPDNYLQIYAGTVIPPFAPSIGSDPLNQREPFRIAFLQKYRQKSVDGLFLEIRGSKQCVKSGIYINFKPDALIRKRDPQ